MSLLNKIFYRIKPVVPRRVQIGLRRIIAARKRRLTKDVWPIDRSAGDPPQNWSGWPEGKRFALILTHDVETGNGHGKCREVMGLERRMGFRSSFNFVAKRYEASKELRELLTENGFEVGIHGLYHDGRLFESRKVFDERAVLINQYLRAWGSVGFYSPSMLRNLEWIHDLNIEYDQSSFDTDPFEPQPEGAGTIFPFAVYRKSSQLSALGSQLWNGKDRRHHAASRIQHPASSIQPPAPSTQNPINSSNPTDSSDSIDSTNSRHFFIEHPYTLPQDFTLFVILKEKDIRIWKQKLDWIADKGGMALLNTHPDYMNCRAGGCGPEEYPIRFYEEFLNYVKEKYEGQYWHVLPKEMARFWREKMVHRS